MFQMKRTGGGGIFLKTIRCSLHLLTDTSRDIRRLWTEISNITGEGTLDINPPSQSNEFETQNSFETSCDAAFDSFNFADCSNLTEAIIALLLSALNRLIRIQHQFSKVVKSNYTTTYNDYLKCFTREKTVSYYQTKASKNSYV